MEKRNLIIVGLGSTAERIYRFVNMYGLYNIIGFAVDSQYKQTDVFCDLPVYEIEKLRDVVERNHAVLFVAVFWNNLNKDRKILYERLKTQGYEFANIISPNAIVRGNINGDNCWINDFVVIQSNVNLADNIFVMNTALIGNEANICSHVFIAPAKIGGGANIGEQCFIGINAVVFDDAVVGDRCIIGACTAIKRNVPDNTVCKVAADNVISKTYDTNIIESKLRTNHNIR